jgi:hypothetical protein
VGEARAASVNASDASLVWLSSRSRCCESVRRRPLASPNVLMVLPGAPTVDRVRQAGRSSSAAAPAPPALPSRDSGCCRLAALPPEKVDVGDSARSGAPAIEEPEPAEEIVRPETGEATVDDRPVGRGGPRKSNCRCSAMYSRVHCKQHKDNRQQLDLGHEDTEARQ